MATCFDRKPDLANWCRALPRPPPVTDCDSDETGAFFRPTSTALRARRSLAEIKEVESKHNNENNRSLNEKALTNGTHTLGTLINTNKLQSIIEASGETCLAANQTGAISDKPKPIIANNDECAIEDDEDDNQSDDEDLWEDEDALSYNANGSAVIKTAFAFRPNQLRKKQQRSQTRHSERESDNPVIGGKFIPARHPDGTFISNLSQQFREAARLAELAALTCPESITTDSTKEQCSRTTTPGRTAANTVSLFTNGANHLPDPLRCCPVTVTPPPTPLANASQTPNLPPPAPPSTPQVVPSRRPRFGSTASLRALLTPPMTPTAAIATMATAVATFSSSGGTTSTIALMAVSGASSGTASTRATSVSSSLSNATPKEDLSMVPPKSAILHIEQIQRSSYRARNGMSIDGEPQGLLPYNGYSGPRLEPFVDLGAQVSLDYPSASTDNSEQPCFRRKLIRSASSDLMSGEMTDLMRRQIQNENKTRYIFQHFGTRRFIDPAPGSVTARRCPFQRSLSMQNVQNRPLLEVSESDKAKGITRGPNGHPHPLFRQVYFVDDYKEPEDWTWERDYHTKGW
ncbi:hypothetical protein SEPCBS119000_005339 [Sporothrix epigloea]|uniref:Uncharacterized protein n=1 Tax=Sporothrix epigloea TaxID=1892477 RepID=A0ABP0DY92_9PEZI